MAFRVTIDDVKDILDTAMGDGPMLAFIAVANVVVNQRLLLQNYPDELLKEIERWLAAHYACMRDPRLHSQGVHNAQTTYEGQTGEGFAASRYGQQAMRLDVNGILVQLDTATAPSTFEVF